jgi:hypothetical protein
MEATSGGRTVWLSERLGTTGDSSFDSDVPVIGTDYTAAVQAVLDEAAGGVPLSIIWDARVSVTGLDCHSNTSIAALPGCGAVLRNGVTRPLFANANPSKDAITLKNFVIDGGVWHGNYNIADPRENETWGIVVGFQFSGFQNVQLRNMTIRRTRTFAVSWNNGEGILIENVRVDQGVAPESNQDGFHAHGFAHDTQIRNCWLRTGDDGIVFTANDAGLGLYRRNGPITNLRTLSVV